MSGRFEIVRQALLRGEHDSRLLDGRDFDANYWRNARRQLTVIERDNFITERERDAYRAFISEDDEKHMQERDRT